MDTGKGLFVFVREPPEVRRIGSRIDRRELGVADGFQTLGTELAPAARHLPTAKEAGIVPGGTLGLGVRG